MTKWPPVSIPSVDDYIKLAEYIKEQQKKPEPKDPEKDLKDLKAKVGDGELLWIPKPKKRTFTLLEVYGICALLGVPLTISYLIFIKGIIKLLTLTP
jgi:hypothetical protein